MRRGQRLRPMGWGGAVKPCPQKLLAAETGGGGLQLVRDARESNPTSLSFSIRRFKLRTWMTCHARCLLQVAQAHEIHEKRKNKTPTQQCMMCSYCYTVTMHDDSGHTLTKASCAALARSLHCWRTPAWMGGRAGGWGRSEVGKEQLCSRHMVRLL